MFLRFHPIKKTFLVACSLIVSLTLPTPGRSAEWTLEPSLNLRREYNDNIRLTIQPHESVYGSIVAPSLNFGIHMPTWDISGEGNITQRRYSGQEGLDRDDNLLRIFSAYRTERSTTQLEASHTRDSVLTGEYISSDTGVAQAHRKRKTDSVSPAWSWMFSERIRLQMAYQHTDVSYEDAQDVGLYDYQYRAVTTTLTNQLSELSQVFISVGYTTFHVPFTEFDSDTRSLQAGITRNFSATTRGTLQAGVRRTESFVKGGNPVYTPFFTGFDIIYVQTGVTQDTLNDDTRTVFSGNLESKLENMRVSVFLSRALEPSGSGGQIEQDKFRFDVGRQLSALSRVFVIVNAMEVRNLEGNIANNERTYYDIAPGVHWKWSREWGMSANYRYAHVKRVYESTSAESNSVNLMLTYQPSKWSLSR